MPQSCLYLHLHQPYRLSNFNVFDLSGKKSYFSKDVNKKIFHKVAQKSYFPMLSLLKKLCEEEAGFKLAFSVSGIFLEQAMEFEPGVIQLIKDILATGKLEILAETYYHSLAFLYSKNEFDFQVNKHIQLIEDVFGYKPRVFRNTELAYSNDIAHLIRDFNFLGTITEAVDRCLHGRKRTQLFVSNSEKKIPLLLKHAQLSDDLAFRFGDKSWKWHPLPADRYLDWVEIYPEDEFVNLFMDFETFGEHQWADTGIFEFFEHFVKKFLAKPWNKFVTPSEVFSKLYLVPAKNSDKKVKRSSQKQTTITHNPLHSLPVYDVPEMISWADVNRDLTAWRDNSLQWDTLKIIYELEEAILNSGDEQLIEDWRKLQISDHFYYMCTKWSADGDVHAYFSPHDSPFEAYRKYAIVLADLKERLI